MESLMNLSSFLISTVVGFFFGILSNWFASDLHPSYRKWKNKQKRKRWKSIFGDKQVAHIDAVCAGKTRIYDNLIALDVSEDEFSEIAKYFMDDDENDNFIITNIQEPCWFYEQFKKSVISDKGDDTIQKLLLSFEENVIQFDFNSASKNMNELIELFYVKNKLKVFPHLRAFVNSESNKKVRVNFFKLNMGRNESKEAFKMRNKLWEVYFFERFINYKTDSYFVNINNNLMNYKGTDALIINHRRILYYDDFIDELNYQNICLNTEITNGFFHNVVKNVKNNSTFNGLSSTKCISEEIYPEVGL